METIPPPPRPLTPAARKRSWAEMPVRVWCVLTVVLFLVIAYFITSQVIAGAAERKLILQGVHVDAVLTKISNTSNPAAAMGRAEPLFVTLRFNMPGVEKPVTTEGLLPVANKVVHPQDHIELRVDPEDPSNWTDRLEPRGWLVELSAGLLLVPLLLLLFIIAMLKRAQVLRIWRNGEQAEAIVIDARQTAIAPLSRMVRMALAEGDDRRVFGILMPVRMGIPAEGERVDVIMPRGEPRRSVLTSLYR